VRRRLYINHLLTYQSVTDGQTSLLWLYQHLHSLRSDEPDDVLTSYLVKILMKMRLTTKTNKLMTDLFKGHTSCPYNSAINTET